LSGGDKSSEVVLLELHFEKNGEEQRTGCTRGKGIKIKIVATCNRMQMTNINHHQQAQLT
jgi:hypothetical protein